MQGWRRQDGRTGIRNVVAVAYLVECAHHVAREIALPLREDGVQMALEVGAFGLSLLMAGWLGVTTEAAHKVAIDVASMTYMAASGIAAAATIRVGNLRGAGDLPAARQAGFAAYWLTFGFMGAMGILLISTRHLVPYIYISDPQVVAQAATLLLIAALFQVSDGLQVVGLGALRGLEDVKVPSIVALLAYWVVALPLGYFLGFRLHLGAPGVWLALLLGLNRQEGTTIVMVTHDEHQALKTQRLIRLFDGSQVG